MKELSDPAVKKLSEAELIALINSDEHGRATEIRARRALTTLDANYERTGHLLYDYSKIEK